MTREKRYELLKKMWDEIPLSRYAITDKGNYWRWQGMTATLLSFNPKLQSDFRFSIKKISEGGSSRESMSLERYKLDYENILAILSEAINETSIPEEKPALVLTDDHGIWWFINHCTWKSRLTLFAHSCLPR